MNTAAAGALPGPYHEEVAHYQAQQIMMRACCACIRPNKQAASSSPEGHSHQNSDSRSQGSIWSAYGLHEASIERTRHPFWGNFSMQPYRSDRRAHPNKNSILLILQQAVARPVAELKRHEPGSCYIGLVRSEYGWSRRPGGGATDLRAAAMLTAPSSRSCRPSSNSLHPSIITFS
jgi:hypothetical protein